MLVSPHATGLVVDSGGLTVTLGGLTATGNSTITGTLGGVTTLTCTTVTATNLGGTLSTAAQGSVTSLGTLTALTTSGTLTMTAAASKIVPGATSFSIRNAADGQDNLIITNAGAATIKTSLSLSAANTMVTLDRSDGAGTLAFMAWNRGGANKFLLGTDSADSFVIYNSVPTQLLTLSATGIVTIGTPAARSGTAPTLALNIFNGTAPTGTLANGVTIYATAGEAYIMDAGGTATLQSPHDDDGNWIFDSTDTTTSKRLLIDVEKLLRAVNDHLRTDFVHDLMGVR